MNSRKLLHEKFFTQWLGGIPDEIRFWNAYMRTQGGEYSANFNWTVDSQKKFQLEEDLDLSLGACKFIDVGSGPFSRCGRLTDLVDLEVEAVDPLGDVYEQLKEKYSLRNGINVKSGFVECLDKKYEANSFDMVHMSNSLDHCFDPIFGIYQLIRICKIGGKVILRHKENEAVTECYNGLHQWNLSCHRAPGELWIWNKDLEYNVNTEFAEYVDVECYIDQEEKKDVPTGLLFNKVVLRKKKNIEVQDNPFYGQMLELVYKKLLFEYLAQIS